MKTKIKGSAALICLLMMMTFVSAAPHIAPDYNPTVTCFADGCVVGVTLRNTGTDMTGAWLLELQPRPHGMDPLSISTQGVCDATHPENVNREFFIAAGQSEGIVLSSKVGAGDYDLYLLPRDRCWNWFQGNSVVPIYNSAGSSQTWGSYLFVGTFHVGGQATTTTTTIYSTTTTGQSTTTTTPGGIGGGLDLTLPAVALVLIGLVLLTRK